MTEEQRARMEYLWLKCCDMRQVMSDVELHELGELLEMENAELDRVEV